jgi:hypothetical protein
MRAVILWGCITAALLAASCGTPYRYEYYDYGGKTIDEKNKEREEAISRKSRGIIPTSSGVQRWMRR